MNTALRLAGFGVGLLAVFGAAVGVGAAVAPAATPAAPAAAAAAPHGEDHTGTGATTAASMAGAATVPGGLMVSQDGYTLALAERSLPAGPQVPLRFEILGPDGAPVTHYDTEHDKDLHLIVVRRDQAHFQHVHPVLGDDGTWSVPVDLPAAGEYRVFADFTPTGHDGGLTLGADLAVPGAYQPVPLPDPATSAAVVDGYAVALAGDLVPGRSSELTLTVSRDGAPVTDLQPYLAAYGHLVALRAGDLAYLHVHPAGAPGDGVTPAGPGITFYATAPTAGDYRLYLDFQHNGVVRTAEFTVHAGQPNGTAAAPATGGVPTVTATAVTATDDTGHGDTEPDGHGH
jgi:hypothetical protein